ncbi:MAG: polymer-forming cytoskeletal protein [Gemmatimonadaceae bacterium]
MRALVRTLLAIAAVVPCALGAQEKGAVPAQGNAAARDLDLLRRESIAGLSSADSISSSGRTIAAGATVSGNVLARGPVVVAGKVDGSVVSLAGDVTVKRGGVVTGDAVAVGGRVVADSGEVRGEMRSMDALPSAVAAAPVVEARTPIQQTFDSLRLVAGTFGVLLVIAIGVLLFAGPNLDEVVVTLEHRFGRAFWTGLLGQLMILPALALLVVVLAVSLIGILLIPFAIVAYAIAVAGLFTLGFLAVARLIGGAMRRVPGSTPRSQALSALAVGVAMFFALWTIAALFTWAPLAASVVRAAALAATWAALTLGLGATLLSRAGTHRKVAAGTRPVELAAWQTPTPLTGVVAARRPKAVATEGR